MRIAHRKVMMPQEERDRKQQFGCVVDLSTLHMIDPKESMTCTELKNCGYILFSVFISVGQTSIMFHLDENQFFVHSKIENNGN